MKLDTATLPQLKAELRRLGGDCRGNLGRATIIKRIESSQEATGAALAEAPFAAPTRISALPDEPSVIPVDSLPVTRPVHGGCTQKEILEAIAVNVELGMEAIFYENCWQFSRNGRTDSGTLSQPVYNIKKCADMVCQRSINASRVLKNAADR